MSTPKQRKARSALPSPGRGLVVVPLLLGLVAGAAPLARISWLPQSVQPYAPLLSGLLVAAACAAVVTLLVDRPLREAARAEKAGREVLLAHLVDALLVIDDRGTIQFANPAAGLLFGYPAEEVIGQPFSSLVDEDSTARPSENQPGSLPSAIHKSGVSETIGRRKEGATFNLELAVGLIREGDAPQVVVQARDISERKSAEQELRQREARKSTILESAIDCIITLDAKGRVTEVNSAVEKILGYDHSQMMGKRLAELIFPPSMDERNSSRVWQNFATVGGFVLGKPIEVTAMRANGTEFPAELVVGSVNLQGNLNYTASLRDVTRRKRLEQRQNILNAVTTLLQEAEDWKTLAPRLLKALCEALEWDAAVLWAIDTASNALRCAGLWQQSPPQRNFAKMHEQSTLAPGSGLAGRVWVRREASWITDVDKESSLAPSYMAAKVGVHGACAFPLAAGGQIYGVIELFSLRPQPLAKDLLSVLATVGVQIGQYLDQRRVEETLRDSESRFRRLADHAPALIWCTGPDGRRDFLNHGWLRFAGRSQGQELGDGWREGIHPEDRTHFGGVYHTAAEARRPFEVEYRHRRHDGAYRWLLTHAAPRFAADGSFTGYMGASLDITERNRLEEDFNRTRAAVELAGANRSQVLAHLRREGLTPLDTLVAVAESLLSTELSIEQREYLELVRASAQALRSVLLQPPQLLEAEASTLTNAAEAAGPGLAEETYRPPLAPSEHAPAAVIS